MAALEVLEGPALCGFSQVLAQSGHGRTLPKWKGGLQKW